MHVIQSPGPGHSSVGNAAPSLSGSYDAIGIEQLEAVLRQHIHDYLFPRGLKPRSLRTLEADIGADLSLTPGARSLGLDEEERVLKRRVPSYEYIRRFYKERQSICINYMNTLAHFFRVRYVVTNFDVV
jgi:hypothetical protein